MTTISSQEDFLQALRDNPTWRDAIRAQILGDELLQLPVRFNAFEKRFDAFEQRVETRFEEVDARLYGMDARIDSLEKRMDARFDRMEGDLSEIKGYFAETTIARTAPLIALELGQQHVRNLELKELLQMAQQGSRDNLPVIVNSPAGSIESFAQADLVMETEDEIGTRYIAVEVSFTGALRDFARARRNADFLTALTGRPTTAVIASVRNDWEVEARVNAGQAHWHRIPERDRTPEA